MGRYIQITKKAFKIKIILNNFLFLFFLIVILTMPNKSSYSEILFIDTFNFFDRKYLNLDESKIPAIPTTIL